MTYLWGPDKKRGNLGPVDDVMGELGPLDENMLGCGMKENCYYFDDMRKLGAIDGEMWALDDTIGEIEDF